MNRGIEPVDQTEAEPFQPGPGDHRSIVGAQRHGRRDKAEARRCGQRPKAVAQPQIGGDPAGGDEAGAFGMVAAKPGNGVCRAIDQRIADRQLDGRGKIGGFLGAERSLIGDRLPYRGLQPGEREIAPLAPFERPRQRESAGIATARRALDRRPAGVVEPQELGGLVEGFARRIVTAGAELVVAADPGAHQKLGMAAGNQQQEIRKPDILREPDGEGMGFQMVDRDEWLRGRPGDALCRHRADDEAADQPRPGRRRHAIEPIDGCVSLGEGAPDEPLDMVEMRPRRDLRHDAAIGRVLLQLGVDQIGLDQRPRMVAHHRDRGLVAARLDAENGQASVHPKADGRLRGWVQAAVQRRPLSVSVC